MDNKTIIFLMNGFGMESKESYSVYDASLMPTLDKLTKQHLFSTINSNVNNYYDGYRNMSLDINELYNYSILDEQIENKMIPSNQNLIKLKQDLDTKKSNLHIFVLLDTSLKLIDHLKEYLKYLNPNKNKKIYLHLIISSNSLNDYKKLVDICSKLNMEFNNVAPIGFILGLSSIDNNAKDVDLNFFFKMFISKVGEKWQSFTQKFDVLYGTKVLPRNTKPFLVNTSFELSKDDIFLIYNYDNINLTNFFNVLSNIRFGEQNNNFSYYSLFKVTSNLNIPYMYRLTIPNNYLVKNLENINSKALIICKKEEVSIINYFCNGLKNEPTTYLSYLDIDQVTINENTLINIIDNAKENLIIFNFSIEECKDVKEIKDKLKEIDNKLAIIYKNMQGSKYSIIVSSLYGITKIMINEKNNLCQVNFSGKVPFVFVDDFITKKNYLVTGGNINGIIKTAYKNIKKDSKYESLVERQNGLYKLFFSKK